MTVCKGPRTSPEGRTGGAQTSRSVLGVQVAGLVCVQKVGSTSHNLEVHTLHKRKKNMIRAPCISIGGLGRALARMHELSTTSVVPSGSGSFWNRLHWRFGGLGRPIVSVASWSSRVTASFGDRKILQLPLGIARSRRRENMFGKE